MVHVGVHHEGVFFFGGDARDLSGRGLAGRSFDFEADLPDGFAVSTTGDGGFSTGGTTAAAALLLALFVTGGGLTVL